MSEILERLAWKARDQELRRAYDQLNIYSSRKILDLSAGNRAVWFQKYHRDCTYVDIRPEVQPDVVADSRALPESIGKDYGLIVFDPPHANFGKNGNMAKDYGHYTCPQIRELIASTAKEAHRVSTPNALMALKWNDHDIKLKTVLLLMAEWWEPLFGHPVSVRRPRLNQTYWVLLRKIEIEEEKEE